MKPFLPEYPTPYPHVVAPLYGDTPDSGITWREDRLSIDVARHARFHPKSARSGLPELAGAELPHALSQGKTLDVELPILRENEPIHLVVNSTGLKVYGEGEWKVRQHGYSQLAHGALLYKSSVRMQ